jgi:hypothetical protein
MNVVVVIVVVAAADTQVLMMRRCGGGGVWRCWRGIGWRTVVIGVQQQQIALVGVMLWLLMLMTLFLLNTAGAAVLVSRWRRLR